MKHKQRIHRQQQSTSKQKNSVHQLHRGQCERCDIGKSKKETQALVLYVSEWFLMNRMSQL